MSPQAIHQRLVAVRKAIGLSAKELAEGADLKYTTFKSQEAAGSPSLRTLDFFWRAFDIDPNFILGGDFSKIHPDTLSAIVALMDDPESKSE